MRTFRTSAGLPARPPKRPEGMARRRRVDNGGVVGGDWVVESGDGKGGVRWDLRDP